MKLSIIIPVYNTEAYLKECLGSIVPQLTDDMEVILVNDGSTDNSQKICEVYQAKYSQVRLINQENQGLSAARNTGIYNANGDYLLFVDSDDFINETVLQDLLQFTNNQDVIFLDAIKYYNENWSEPLLEGYRQKFICQKSSHQVLEFLSTLPKFPGCAWNKLVRRGFLLEHNLYFTKGIYSEDIDWTLSLFKFANHYSYYCKKTYYYYRQGRETSITNNIGVKNVESLVFILEKWTTDSAVGDYKDVYFKFLAYEYIITLLSFAYLSKEKQSHFKDSLLQYSFLLQYRDGITYRLAEMSIKVFGISVSSYLLRKYQNIRLKWSQK